MRSSNEHIASLEDASYRELRLLEEVDGRPDVSQRQLARNLGVALGVANLLVRTMARKGYIKMTHLSWRRWVYVVTPRGMARKVQLTLSYVDRFIGHYRRVRTILYDDLNGLALNKESRVRHRRDGRAGGGWPTWRSGTSAWTTSRSSPGSGSARPSWAYPFAILAP